MPALPPKAGITGLGRHVRFCHFCIIRQIASCWSRLEQQETLVNTARNTPVANDPKRTLGPYDIGHVPPAKFTKNSSFPRCPIGGLTGDLLDYGAGRDLTDILYQRDREFIAFVRPDLAASGMGSSSVAPVADS
jgi:hypothetical protein